MNASVAQSVVHLTRNEKVACSSHVTSSRIARKIKGFSWLFFYIPYFNYNTDKLR